MRDLRTGRRRAALGDGSVDGVERAQVLGRDGSRKPLKKVERAISCQWPKGKDCRHELGYREINDGDRWLAP